MIKNMEILACVASKPDALQISVAIPKGKFLIHPEDFGEEGPFWVCRHNEKWHLITDEIASGNYIPGKKRARLYRGMREDGSLFILPVTLASSEDQRSWEDAWLEILETDRKRWLMLKYNAEEQRHEHTSFKASKSHQWPTQSFEKWLITGFRGRIITTLDHPAMQQIMTKITGS